MQSSLAAALWDALSPINLAKEGLKPVVIEKSDIGGEASGSNGGGVRQSARNLKEMPLAMESIQIYGQLHEELGMDVEYVPEEISGSALPMKSLRPCDNRLKIKKPPDWSWRCSIAGRCWRSIRM